MKSALLLVTLFTSFSTFANIELSEQLQIRFKRSKVAVENISCLQKLTIVKCDTGTDRYFHTISCPAFIELKLKNDELKSADISPDQLGTYTVLVNPIAVSKASFYRREIITELFEKFEKCEDFIKENIED